MPRDCLPHLRHSTHMRPEAPRLMSSWSHQSRLRNSGSLESCEFSSRARMELLQPPPGCEQATFERELALDGSHRICDVLSIPLSTVENEHVEPGAARPDFTA